MIVYSPAMEFEYNYARGHFETLNSFLRRSLAHYSKSHKEVRIGYAGNPGKQVDIHRKQGFSKMVVSYRTTSGIKAKKVEKYLRGEYLQFLAEGISENGLKDSKEIFVYFLLK